MYSRLTVLREMEVDIAKDYHLFSDADDNHDPFIRNGSEFIDEKQIIDMARCGPRRSILKYIKASLELSVICGILFGLFATFLWWIELHATPHCFGKWDEIPIQMQRLKIIVDAVKVSIIMFWPLLTIIPICSWQMIKESNLVFWCTIASLFDVTDRLCLFIFDHYGQRWKSLIGNVLFSFVSFIIFYKFVKYRQQKSHHRANAFIITLKVGMQLIFGLLIFLPYNYRFLKFYYDSSPLVRTILSCSLISLVYVPKMIISNLITNIQGICKPDESIIFGVGFLILSNMVLRLTQAKIESLTYFTIISLVHGICNIIDKSILPLREKFCRLCCRRRHDRSGEYVSLNQQYIAHQSLVNMITETSSVIMSNAAAYLLGYYFQKEEVTGKMQEKSFMIREIVIRSSIAICIEWFFNIIALKIQNDWYEIPVLGVWKLHWKFVMTIHLIQIIYVVVYSGHYVNVMLMDDIVRNSTQECIGLFRMF